MSERDTREAILEAAITGLLQMDAERLLGAVGVRELARRAGMSTSSLYRTVGSLAGLAEAVNDHLFEPRPQATADELARARLIPAEPFPLGVSYAIHDSELRRFTADSTFAPRMALWAFGGEAARAAYRRRLRTFDHDIGVAIAANHQAWGREIRPPFTPSQLGALVTAILIGAGRRHVLDPSAERAEHFGWITLAMLIHTTRAPGDPADVDARLAELTYYPSDGPGPASTEISLASRVLFAARELFLADSYDEATLRQIARRASTTTRTLHRLYGDKAGVAVALLQTEARELLAVPDPVELRAVLLAVVGFCRPRRPYLAPYVLALALGEIGDGDPLLAAVHHAVHDAMEAGDAEERSADEAGWLLLDLLQRLLHTPHLDDVALVAAVGGPAAPPVQ